MKTVLAAMFALVCMGAAPASAGEGKGITGPELAAILQAEGYKAKLDKDDGGDPLVRTAMGGVNVNVLFYDCTQGRCGSLQFRVGIDLDKGATAADVGRFNADYRYANAYLDEESDPFLKFDFEVLHTDHAAHVASQLGIWEDVLDAFLDEMGFRDDDDSEGVAAGDRRLQ